MTDKTSAADRRVDMMIRLALLDIAEEKWKQIEALDVSDVTLSERHIKRMRKLLTKGAPAIRRKRIAKRMLLVALVALSVVAMLGMAIRPVRQAFSNAIITWYNDFFKVEMVSEGEVIYPNVFEKIKEPKLLSDWTSIVVNEGDASRIVKYENQTQSIYYRQLTRQAVDQTVDSEHTIVETEVNGKPAILYKGQEGEKHILQWMDEEYLYQIESGLSPEFILQVAESVE